MDRRQANATHGSKPRKHVVVAATMSRSPGINDASDHLERLECHYASPERLSFRAPSQEEIVHEVSEVLRRAPRVQLPVLGAEQLARPGPVEAGRAHRVHPGLERNRACSSPDPTAALIRTRQRSRRSDAIAYIDAADEPPVDPGDVVWFDVRIPQVPEINGQSDIVLSRVVQNLQHAREIAERGPRERLDVETDAELPTDRPDLLQVCRGFAH